MDTQLPQTIQSYGAISCTRKTFKQVIRFWSNMESSLSAWIGEIWHGATFLEFFSFFNQMLRRDINCNESDLFFNFYFFCQMTTKGFAYFMAYRKFREWSDTWNQLNFFH